MTLKEEDDSKIDKSMISIIKQLDTMEITWTGSQKDKKKARLIDNLRKKRRANDFVDVLLIKCKQHNGPVTSVD